MPKFKVLVNIVTEEYVEADEYMHHADGSLEFFSTTRWHDDSKSEEKAETITTFAPGTWLKISLVRPYQ